MFPRRIAYLTALSGCAVFYIAYGEWFSWLLLVLVLALPWLSLAVSLPAMLTFRIRTEGGMDLPLRAPGKLWLRGSSRLPMPPFRGQIRLERCFDGARQWYDSDAGVPTDHCGGWRVRAWKVRICDYLGLFALPVKCPEPELLRVRPLPQPMAELPGLDRFLARAWSPKFGGGFAEHHELRPYRPGDNLNQVHWKLTAKTGKWMLREPMEPRRGLVLVTVDISGTPDELDRKLGRLLWLGQYLLDRQVPFQLRALTGEGIHTARIPDAAALKRQMDLLLCAPAGEGTLEDRGYAASWHCHIGGDPHEP